MTRYRSAGLNNRQSILEHHRKIRDAKPFKSRRPSIPLAIEPFRTREMQERKNHVREPFKLIVWGPGGLGAICIREALRLPEFELAGVRTYGPAKVGIDAGTLVASIPPAYS
jgi:hypothetical protein